MVRPLAPIVAACVLVACGGGSSTPSAPTPTTPTIAAFSLSGTVRDDAGQAVGGATVAILDGANANRAAITDAAGSFTLTGLSSGGFTVRVRREGHDDLTRSVTLTSSTTLELTIARSRINLSGALTGFYTSIDFFTRQRYRAPVTATVTQTGTSISGTFRIQVSSDRADDWTGSFSGTLSSIAPPAQYSGTLAVSGLISTASGRCNGTRGNATGTASTSELTLSAPGLWRWDECQDSLDDTLITLSR